MAERLAIYGAGGLGRETLQVLRDVAESGRAVECVGFVVDPAFDATPTVNGAPVFRDVAALAGDETIAFVIAIGDPAARARVAGAIERRIGPRFGTAIHPRAWIGATVSVGEGSIVFGHSSITADARVGRHVLVNPGCTIAHDAVLDDFVSLSPGVHLAGHVRVEEGCFLGVGASVMPRVSVGRWSIVGAGATVIRDVPRHATVVGVPARVIATRAGAEAQG